MILYIGTAVLLSLCITFFVIYKKNNKVKLFVDPKIAAIKKINWKPIMEKAKEYNLQVQAKNFISYFLNKKK